MQAQPMSALGHKRTFAVQYGMSALPPIADIHVGYEYAPLVRRSQQPTIYSGMLARAAGRVSR
jgi:hypothetical protein